LQKEAEDILCRWGGEEFLLALPECTIADAVRLADEIRLSVSASRIEYEGANIQLNVSAGVAELIPGESIDSLLNRADQALYRAKTSGKNRVVKDSATPECP
jgi:diguanylate cyclase (GGDEF)-like protein